MHVLLLQAKLPCPQKSTFALHAACLRCCSGLFRCSSLCIAPSKLPCCTACCLPALLLWFVQVLLNVRCPQQAAALQPMLPACHAALLWSSAAECALSPANCCLGLDAASLLYSSGSLRCCEMASLAMLASLRPSER